MIEMSSMTFNDVLVDLLGNLRLTDHSILIDWDTTQQWPDSALDTFLRLGILSSASSAQSLQCHGCEKHCFMDVISLTDKNPKLTRAFIVCDDPEMQHQIGRVNIPLERLKQWQCSIQQLAEVIANLLGLEDKITVNSNQHHIKLGMLKAGKGRRWITLNISDLSLAINTYTKPVDELLYFEDEQLLIDLDSINDLLNREPITKDKIYIPSSDNREKKKLETQAMYEDWNDAYFQLQKDYPNQSKSSCATKIAKMSIAQGRDAGTIRRNLK